MKKVTVFIAMSLDGYIADSGGGVDWLAGQGNDDDNIDSYSAFVKEIDTVVMGWNTYHQIVTELSPDEWVYSDFTAYVITHNTKVSSESIRFVNGKKITGRGGKGDLDLRRGRPDPAVSQRRHN